ncbi:acyl-CoA synthetase (AMP-forming)/AMP-acid ligase II [Cylindrospermum stagnale PCC 7417]|uniref:Acyl-CoA synthetase (AMP-forming)/AMP-acid ligase II n=1 Tax=Cylindrospermum stagnale PCC 7417 TaxID=56107 RepID=K9WS68_9NOST|nr:fatty acid--CoA ligase family protein [Cylindrospermum stagnale]AFZ22402.1 acyl-CoA synthetase (AMP-forming)/AMP-acid ligase II [Cylindrospermum stagnale PCC 7417]
MKILSFLNCSDESIWKKPAFVTSKQIYTYQDVRDRIAAMVNFLRDKGVIPGQRVLMIADHDEYAVFFFLAASAIGIQVLIPYNLKEAAFNEWLNILEIAQPEHIIYLKKTDITLEKSRISGVNLVEIDRTQIEIIDKTNTNIIVEDPNPVENFLVLFTSGTTGKPKAISLQERLIALRVLKVSTTLKFHSDAHIMMSGLMSNTTGIINSLGSLAHNATLFFPNSPDVADWAPQIQQHRLTHIMMRPVSMKNFLEDSRTVKADLSSLEIVAYGAAPLPVKDLEKGRKLMPCEWIQGYGLSETFGPFCWLTEEDHKAEIYAQYVHCIGRPDDTVDVAVFDPSGNKLPPNEIGEIVVHSLGVMAGYCNFPKNIIESVGEWFHTGDFGMFSSEGYLVLKGREAETVLTPNGYKIYPSEIEHLLYQIPGVEEAVLVSWSSSETAIEYPVVCIYTISGQGDPVALRDALSESFRNMFSPEKWPNFLYISPEPLPKNQNGKIAKRDILPFIKPENVIKFSVN